MRKSEVFISVIVVIILSIISYNILHNGDIHNLPKSSSNSSEKNVSLDWNQIRENEIETIKSFWLGDYKITYSSKNVYIYKFEKLDRSIIYVNNKKLSDILIWKKNEFTSVNTNKFLNYVDWKIKWKKEDFPKEIEVMNSLLKKEGISNEDIKQINTVL